MPQTAEIVAAEWRVSREDQDVFALASQRKCAAAQITGRLAEEIVAVEILQRKGEPLVLDTDEHPRPTTLETLVALKPVDRTDGTITAGNASGLHDGAAALIVAGEEALKTHDLKPRARVVGMAWAGVPPRVMGIGPVDAACRLLGRTGLTMTDMEVIELNEAFAAQASATLRDLGVDPSDPRANPNGGAIARGHPLGMSGARLVQTAVEQLHRADGRYGLVFMCVGVGQGICLIVESC